MHALGYYDCLLNTDFSTRVIIITVDTQVTTHREELLTALLIF